MSVVDRVTQGTSVTFEADFYDPNTNGPFVATQAVSYQVRDMNGNLIISGVASQDPNAAFRWTAQINIPATAPVTSVSTDRYVIQWTAVNSNTNASQVQNSSFSVCPAVDFSVIEQDRLALERSPLVDSLALDPSEVITQAQVTVRNEMGTILFDSGVLVGNSIPAPTLSEGLNVYTFNSKVAVQKLTVSGSGLPDAPGLPAPYKGTDAYIPTEYEYQTPVYPCDYEYFHQTANSGFSPLCVQWEYTTQSGSNNEFHFLYVVNTRVIILVHKLRTIIDKARSANPNPVLQYTDVDLVEYLNQGIGIVNMIKPTMTNWSLVNFPQQFTQSVLMMAAFSALSAQYLAEGESAFEMSGQNVSLTVDRTQYIQGMISTTVQQFIDNHIPALKRLWVRSTGGSGQAAGVLGINYGPTLGRVLQGNRMDFYRRMLAGV
jgi:hypothetical protein